MDILYQDDHIVVCIKPARVLSTDEPGGLPDLLRQALGNADIRTVHRLDCVVSGVMVLARNGYTVRQGKEKKGKVYEKYVEFWKEGEHGEAEEIRSST